ncbi:MAG: hypothetical protein NT140_05655 [Deltaproteobacteria bacterium]|nr:hypothetical protein [Deltaproteobacteria bacterium]
MDSADRKFRACFVGVGDKVVEISKPVLTEFNSLIGYYQKCRDDDSSFAVEESNEYPRLMVLSLNEQQDSHVQDIPRQDLIFLVGTQQDPLFWTTREKLITGNRCSFLFTVVLHGTGNVGWSGQPLVSESIIFLKESGSEKRIIKFVKDMSRVWMFPHLLSCDFSDMHHALSATSGAYLSFESQTADCLPAFRQFLSNNLETIQRASGIFYIVSSNLGNDFSISKHLQPVIDEIGKVATGECTVVGCDSLYAEEEASFSATMICGKK